MLAGVCKDAIDKGALRLGTHVLLPPGKQTQGDSQVTYTSYKHFPQCLGSTWVKPAQEAKKVVDRYGRYGSELWGGTFKIKIERGGVALRCKGWPPRGLGSRRVELEEASKVVDHYGRWAGQEVWEWSRGLLPGVQGCS